MATTKKPSGSKQAMARATKKLQTKRKKTKPPGASAPPQDGATLGQRMIDAIAANYTIAANYGNIENDHADLRDDRAAWDSYVAASLMGGERDPPVILNRADILIDARRARFSRRSTKGL